MEEREGVERASSISSQPAAFARRTGGHHDRSGRTEAPAGAESPAASRCAHLGCIPGVRTWGPVPKEQAVGAGALARAASSVLLAPKDEPTRLFQRLAALIPDEVLPRVSDTAHTLRLRLAFSAFIHPIRTLAKGHGRGGRYVALNCTTYPQPRRVQWGSPTVPEHTDADGDRVVRCLCWRY